MVLAMAQSLVQAWAAETAAASAPERSGIKTKQRKRTRDLKKSEHKKRDWRHVPEKAATSAVATEPGKQRQRKKVNLTVKTPSMLLFHGKEQNEKTNPKHCS